MKAIVRVINFDEDRQEWVATFQDGTVMKHKTKEGLEDLLDYVENMVEVYGVREPRHFARERSRRK